MTTMFSAFLLWIFVSLDGEYFTTVDFDIKFTDIPEGFSVSSVSNEKINLQIKAQGYTLAKFIYGPKNDFNIVVKENERMQKINLFNELDNNPWATSSIQVNDISPTSIEFEVEKVDTKYVPLEPVLKLDFKSGYGLIGDIKATPDTVKINGPVSILAGINSLTTVSKPVTGIESNQKIVAEINVPEYIESNIANCGIEFEVQKIVDKTFEEILIETKGVPRSKELIIYPAKIQVILRGGINILGQMSSDRIKAYVTYNQAITDTLGSLKPIVEFPDNVEFIDTRPNKLEYIIKQF
ncbi:MAG: hypothetical protein PVH88_12830 [Ignavibacteria bacterium]